MNMNQSTVHRSVRHCLNTLLLFSLALTLSSCGGASTPSPSASPETLRPTLQALDARLSAAEQQGATAQALGGRVSAAEQQGATAQALGGRVSAAEQKAADANAAASTAMALARETNITPVPRTPVTSLTVGRGIQLTYQDGSGQQRTTYFPISRADIVTEDSSYADLRAATLLVLAIAADDTYRVYYTPDLLPADTPDAAPGKWGGITASAPLFLDQTGAIISQSNTVITVAPKQLDIKLSKLAGDTASQTISAVLSPLQPGSNYWLLLPDSREAPVNYRVIVRRQGGPPSGDDSIQDLVCYICYIGLCQSFCS